MSTQYSYLTCVPSRSGMWCIWKKCTCQNKITLTYTPPNAQCCSHSHTFLPFVNPLHLLPPIYFIMVSQGIANMPGECFLLFTGSHCQGEIFYLFFLPFPVTDPSASIFHLLGESDCTKPLDSVSYHCYTEPALAWKVDHAVVKNGEKPLTPTAHVVYPTHPYRKRPG